MEHQEWSQLRLSQMWKTAHSIDHQTDLLYSAVQTNKVFLTKIFFVEANLLDCAAPISIFFLSKLDIEKLVRCISTNTTS